jgi:hypothetical protein
MASTMATSRWILDEMGSLHGASTWSDETFARMNTCLDQFSDGRHDLQKVLEDGWKGMIEYGISGGALDGSDNWFKAPGASWREYDPTPMTQDNVTFPGAQDVLIYEPCNYVSNIAYHRTMIEICERDRTEGLEWTLPKEYVRGFVEVYNILGMGSAFFHASSTSVGAAIDVVPIDFFALLFVQSSLSSIPFNPILHEIRMPTDEPRQHTAPGFVDAMTEMVSEKSVYEWDAILRNFNAPDQYLTFGAFVSIGIDVLFLDRPDLATDLVELLGGLILNPDQVSFLTEQYMPEFRRVVSSQIPIGGQDRAELSNQFIGTVMKMIYAFYWQEQIVDRDHLDDAEAIARGAEMQPVLNALANEITGFQHVDMEFQQSIDVYPADAKCRAEQPHSIWHEQSGNGLVDMALVSQFADSILRNPQDDGKTLEPGLLFCLVENDCLEGVADGDFGSVINCIQRIPFINPNPPCDDKVNAVGLLGCVPGCDESDTLCLVNCVVDNADIGVTVVDRQ